RLRRYWQFFEMDACLQVQARGYRVLFDFGTVIEHYPTETTFRAGRDGDLSVKVYHPAYNHAFVLSKHLTGWRRLAILGHMLGIGSVGGPGLMGFLVAARRYGHPLREARILWRTWEARLAGWRAGRRARAAGRHASQGDRGTTAGTALAVT
ncbi:MAG TPA: hypothetical protein VKE40_05745, partial [Gemmataceae bacterium]|nr:hypothetical protein [Gemmataceae bacterium]